MATAVLWPTSPVASHTVTAALWSMRWWRGEEEEEKEEEGGKGLKESDRSLWPVDRPPKAVEEEKEELTSRRQAELQSPRCC